ncbi:MAG: hypothetical protein ACFHWX_06925 [Bacteroidota bacterium]
MNPSAYFLNIALGVFSFCSSILILVSISEEATIVDSSVYVVDSGMTKFDEITIQNNKLNFEKNPVTIEEKEMIAESNHITYQEMLFNLSPNYLIWIILVSLGVSTAFTLVIPVWFRFTESISDFPKQRKVIYFLISFISVSIVFVVGQFSAHGRIFAITTLIEYTGILFKNPIWVLGILTGFMILPNWFCLGGNFAIISKVLTTKNITLESLVHYHSRFSFFLIVSSILLVFGVFSSTFLRLSVLDHFSSQYGFLFPSQFVISYSIVFTFFLLVFYLPGELVLRDKFNTIKHGLSEEELKQLDDVLSRLNIFKLGVSLLAPILSGFLLETLRIFS